MSKKITVIGDGGWGTALAMVLHRNGHDVTIWGHDAAYLATVSEKHENTHFLPGVAIDPDIRWSADREEVTTRTEAYVIAVPSKFYQPVLSGFQGLISRDAAVVSVSKGLLEDRRLSDWARKLLGLTRVAALSGPSHAEEVALQAPTAVTIASEDEELARFFQELFNQPLFRVYTSDDIVGVELGGALKNVIAIAAGVSDGLGFGDNSKAALVTRGLAELVRLGTAAGGKPDTFAGLSGVGDLMVTCGSRLSRNRGVGERLGRGETMREIEAGMTMVAEGVFNARTAHDLAEHLGVDAPITREVYRIIYEGGSPSEAMRSLLSRDPKPE
ncbi:MAG: NAD(P)H-dependent glycerol-3-phosphate dehydrogenase [Kiritimatiellia bacterium]